MVDTTPRPSETRRTVRSCTHTNCPSAVTRTSHSSPSAPSSSARRYASSVCSGRAAEDPRWAITLTAERSIGAEDEAEALCWVFTSTTLRGTG